MISPVVQCCANVLSFFYSVIRQTKLRCFAGVEFGYAGAVDQFFADTLRNAVNFAPFKAAERFAKFDKGCVYAFGYIIYLYKKCQNIFGYGVICCFMRMFLRRLNFGNKNQLYSVVKGHKSGVFMPSIIIFE